MNNPPKESEDESRSQTSPIGTRDPGREFLSLRERTRKALARLPFASLAGRTLGEHSTRAALYIFLLTRTIIIVIFILVGQIKVMPDPFNPGTTNSYLSLRKIPISRILNEEAQTADANWYMTIADKGYEPVAFENTTAHNWAFFPLYPLLLRVASRATGELTLTGMLISELLFFFALLLLHKTALAFGLDADAAGRTIFYLAIFPVSYFFSLPVPESLFLLLTTASFYSDRRVVRRPCLGHTLYRHPATARARRALLANLSFFLAAAQKSARALPCSGRSVCVHAPASRDHWKRAGLQGRPDGLGSHHWFFPDATARLPPSPA